MDSSERNSALLACGFSRPLARMGGTRYLPYLGSPVFVFFSQSRIVRIDPLSRTDTHVKLGFCEIENEIASYASSSTRFCNLPYQLSITAKRRTHENHNLLGFPTREVRARLVRSGDTLNCSSPKPARCPFATRLSTIRQREVDVGGFRLTRQPGGGRRSLCARRFCGRMRSCFND